MRRVYIFILLAVFIGSTLGYAQEHQKPITSEQRIEKLTIAILNLKLSFAAEKAGWAEEIKISTNLKARNMRLSKEIKELEELLEKAEAYIVRFEMEPE